MKPDKRLIIFQPGVRLIDPHINTDDRNTLSPLMNLYEALVAVGPRGEYVGVLAQSWQVSSDARRWTFQLRRSVQFHHGETLTARDVVESIRRILNPDSAGELATQGIYHGYLGSARFEAPDDFTVRITTPEPLADLLDFLVKFPIAPHSQFSRLPEQMSGTGPYRLTSARPGQIEMTAFADYWGGKPLFDRLVWQAEPDAQQRVAALLAGEAGLIAAITPAGAAQVRASGRAHLAAIESSVCTVFMCNHARGVCADRRVRQALNYGLDKTDLIQTVMHGAAHPLNGPLTALHLGYNPDTPVYPHDPARARALLAEAGYPAGLELVLDVPLTLPDEGLALAHRMAAQYERIGVKTRVKEFPDRPAYAAMVRDKQIDDACCFDSSPLSTYQVLSDKFHSGLHGAWWQGYANPRVDALIDQARATPEHDARRSLYRQAYQLLNDDAPWIFLHNPVLTWGLGAAAGWRPSPDGLIRIGAASA